MRRPFAALHEGIAYLEALPAAAEEARPPSPCRTAGGDRREFPRRDRVVQTAALLGARTDLRSRLSGQFLRVPSGQEATRRSTGAASFRPPGWWKCTTRTCTHDTIPRAVVEVPGRRIVDPRGAEADPPGWETPVLETDESGRTTATHPAQGTPQGGVICPLAGERLSALVREGVHLLARWPWDVGESPDRAVARRRLSVVSLGGTIPRLIDWTGRTLEGRFRLTINWAKISAMDRRSQREFDLPGVHAAHDRDRFGRDRRYLNVSLPKRVGVRSDEFRELLGSSLELRPDPRRWWVKSTSG